MSILMCLKRGIRAEVYRSAVGNVHSYFVCALVKGFICVLNYAATKQYFNQFQTVFYDTRFSCTSDVICYSNQNHSRKCFFPHTNSSCFSLASSSSSMHSSNVYGWISVALHICKHCSIQFAFEIDVFDVGFAYQSPFSFIAMIYAIFFVGYKSIVRFPHETKCKRIVFVYCFMNVSLRTQKKNRQYFRCEENNFYALVCQSVYTTQSIFTLAFNLFDEAQLLRNHK